MSAGVLLLLFAALCIGLGFALRRAHVWAAGRSVRVDWIRGLLRLPRSYLVDVHHVVARDSYAAWMHVAAAGGALATILLIVLVHGMQLPPRLFAWLLMAALLTMAVGAALVAGRRIPSKPARLSRRGFTRLPLGLAALAIGCALATAPRAGTLRGVSTHPAYEFIALSLVAWGLAELIAFAPANRMKHAFAGALHLVCHPRAARLGASGSVADLAPLDLDAPKLGVEAAADFAWNRLLSFDACIQCGRCEMACPAFAAGQPLNPKKLIQDFVFAMEGRSDGTYSGNPHPGRALGRSAGGPQGSIIGDAAAIHPDTLWACTTCRACVEECPMLIEHVDAVIDLRRFQVLERGALPAKAAGVVEELRVAGNPGGHPLARRFDWATDLRLRVLEAGNSADVLLWLGDAAFDMRGQRTARAMITLLRRAGVDFAILGTAELDCGDLARRLGDEATFQDLARRNIEVLSTRRFDQILTSDPHVFNILKNEYPSLGGRWIVVHHSAFLASLVKGGRLKVKAASGKRLTYHDPCYLGRYNGQIDAPRTLLDSLGLERVEMPRHGMRSMCCGGGGGAPLTDVPGKRRIPDIRMDQARETGAALVAVACPNCALMLEGVVGPRPEVRDLAEILLEALVEST